jgi:hypothetical protein
MKDQLRDLVVVFFGRRTLCSSGFCWCLLSVGWRVDIAVPGALLGSLADQLVVVPGGSATSVELRRLR